MMTLEDVMKAEKALEECANEQARKSTLFDVLAERIVSNDWHVTPGLNRNGVVIYDHSRGERIHGATLAEAITKAMEAEDAR